MTPTLCRASVLLTLCTLAPLHAAAAPGQVTQPVVYGDDDRVDIHAHPDADVRALARNTAVALTSVYRLAYREDEGDVLMSRGSLGSAYSLCEGERFRDQPVSAFCSGSLIAPDLVLTAGHCVTGGQDQCNDLRFVFNYAYDSSTQRSTIEPDDVYACRNIITQLVRGSTGGANYIDYAIVQLDRPATPRHTPAEVATTAAPVAVGQRVIMIGSPSGIPIKIDDGGIVRDARADTLNYFIASTDSFGGNSGSPIFNADTLQQVGLLVYGDRDYESAGSCNRVKVCAQDGCAGEGITYAFRAIEAFCEIGTNEELCGTEPVCGDGYCAWNETGCPADCPAPVCGNDTCEPGELEGCPTDCIKVVPQDWTCSAGSYGTFDGCDRNCGAEDPDCKWQTGGILDGLGDCEDCSSSAGPYPSITALLAAMLVLLGFRRMRRTRAA